MTPSAAFCLVLAGIAGTAPVPPVKSSSHWMRLSPEQRDAQVEAAVPLPFTQRLLAMSAGFLGTPYVHSPLGEGQGVDPDPTLRFDAVDCLTFVETAMAMSLAPRPADVPAVLSQLRYAQRPVYEDRNHLMEAQWLPNNLAKGFLADVTRQYGGPDAVEVAHGLSPASWSSPSSRDLHLPPDRRVTGRFRLQMVPLSRALATARRAPDGSLLVIVREERPFKVTRITHLGFLVRHHGRVRLRHASRNPFGRVVDEDLESFLTRNGRYQKWPVSGVSLFELRAPGR